MVLDVQLATPMLVDVGAIMTKATHDLATGWRAPLVSVSLAYRLSFR